MLLLPIPLCRHDGRLMIESQAHSELRRWLENFEHPTLWATLLSEDCVPRMTNLVWLGTLCLPLLMMLAADL